MAIAIPRKLAVEVADPGQLIREVAVRPGWAGNSGNKGRIATHPPTGPLWEHAGCLYSWIASVAVSGPGMRSGRAAEEAPPTGRDRPHRGQDHELGGIVGDINEKSDPKGSLFSMAAALC
jgi:hypothetical protein